MNTTQTNPGMTVGGWNWSGGKENETNKRSKENEW